MLVNYRLRHQNCHVTRVVPVGGPKAPCIKVVHLNRSFRRDFARVLVGILQTRTEEESGYLVNVNGNTGFTEYRI